MVEFSKKERLKLAYDKAKFDFEWQKWCFIQRINNRLIIGAAILTIFIAAYIALIELITSLNWHICYRILLLSIILIIFVIILIICYHDFRKKHKELTKETNNKKGEVIKAYNKFNLKN